MNPVKPVLLANMLSKNSLLLGFIVGLILPAIAWVVFTVMYPGVVLLNKPAIPYLVAVGLNLLLIRLCNKKGADNTGRGVMLVTFVCIVLLIIFKIRLT